MLFYPTNLTWLIIPCEQESSALKRSLPSKELLNSINVCLSWIHQYGLELDNIISLRIVQLELGSSERHHFVSTIYCQ